MFARSRAEHSEVIAVATDRTAAVPTGLPSVRPPLKWAGGKRWLVPHLWEFWEPYRDRRLVELFCGGLAVTLNLLPEQALLNDLNPHLIAFYAQLKTGFTIPCSLVQDLVHDEAAYYLARERFNTLVRGGQEQSAEAAALFYYLNRTGYNGLCRFNRSGEFNVPFGRYKQINYTHDFLSYQRVFKQWSFTVGDFACVALDPTDVIYADPPYDVQFTQYSKGGFGWAEQERLAEWLAQHRGPVILSNQATDRIVKLYTRLGFELRFFDAPRRINRTGDRTPAREVLALKGL